MTPKTRKALLEAQDFFDAYYPPGCGEAKKLIAEALAEPAPRRLTNDERGFLILENLGPAVLTGGKMSVLEAFELGIDAIEARIFGDVK